MEMAFIGGSHDRQHRALVLQEQRRTDVDMVGSVPVTKRALAAKTDALPAAVLRAVWPNPPPGFGR